MQPQSVNRLTPTAAEKYRQTLIRLRSFARLMDSQFEVPIIRRRIGLDGLVGLIPGVGDLAGFVISSYVIL